LSAPPGAGKGQRRTALFGACREPGGAVITADGELDAANADEFAAHVERSVRSCGRVILDLRGLKFIGKAGFSALRRINVVCSGVHAY
jgi:anti-anti-sigma factor